MTRLDKQAKQYQETERDSPQPRASLGFSLVELMIVVAIIGILASVTIPNFLRFQLKSKFSEAKADIAAIRTAEVAYHVTNGVYMAASASPASNAGASPQAYVAMGPSTEGFEEFGWQPEGQIYFNYSVATTGLGPYTVDASADLDENGTSQVWGYAQPDRTGVTMAGVLGCTGIWDGASATATSTVGHAPPLLATRNSEAALRRPLSMY